MASKKKRGGKNKPEHNKAARLRRKIRDGAELSIEELTWLRAYEASKAPAGRKPAPGAEVAAAPADADDGQEDEDDAPDAEDPADDPPRTEVTPTDHKAPAGADPVAPPPPAPPAPPAITELPPPAPRLAAPPRTKVEDEDEPRTRRMGTEDWRDRFRAANRVSSREGTVLFVADQWKSILDAMASQLRAIGVEPKIDPNMLYPAIVLTVDDLLPDVKITPQHLAVGGSALVLTQTFMNRAKIKEALDRERDRADFAARNRARAERAAEEQRTQEAAAQPPPAPPAPAAPEQPIEAQPEEAPPEQPAIVVEDRRSAREIVDDPSVVV